jgi:hypothetical protein
MRRLFSALWSNWKELTHYIGDFQSRLLLTVFYFTLALPFGLLGRFVMDPLALRKGQTGSNWSPRETVDKDLTSARGQF